MNIPTEPPSWIKHWPSPHTIMTLYQHGVKVSYAKSKNSFNYSQFIWNDSELKISVDRFRCSWQWNGLVWVQKCNCNFPGGKCVHTYALAMKMNEYVRINDFLSSEQAQENISRVNHSASPIQSTLSNNQRDLKSRELVIEADFKTSNSETLLRFYSVENDMRTLMKLSLLRNICAVAGYGTSGRNVWNKRDIAFMVWLHPYFREISNLELEKWTAMKVSKKRFDQWLIHWRDLQPGRFIERDTQQALTCGDNTIKIFFELHPVEDRTRIDCISVFPDGKRVCFHELAKEMKRQSKQENPDLESEYVFFGGISRFDYPITARQLWDLFSKKNPSIATVALCPNLPVLLENRLDLVSGSLVKKNINKANVQLMLRIERGKLIFTPSYKGKSIDEVSSIKLNSDFLEIDVYDFNYLDELKIYLKDFGYDGSNAVMEINSNNLSMLAKLWPERPGVELDCDVESANLLTPQVPEIKIDAVKAGNWLDLSTSWELDNQYSFHSENINNALKLGQEFVRSREGKWLRLDLDALLAGHQALLERGIENGTNRRIISDAVKMLKRAEFRKMLSDTARFTLDGIESRLLPDFNYGKNFKAILRPYQLEGFAFLKEMTRYGIGCVLADDMGLGKTVQILAVVSGLKQLGSGPSLVCAPASVLSVWRNEVKKFAPDLRVEICHGAVAKREQLIRNAHDYDLLITSYGSARNDASLLAESEFQMLILDEAQYIRNPQTLTYEAILKLKS
ncbi:MAG: SNF2-related protein, partial [Lentisphaeria bacterium]